MYGLTWNEKGTIYLTQLISIDGETTELSYRGFGSILEINKRYINKLVYDGTLLDIHQIFYKGGEIFCADTGNNRLLSQLRTIYKLPGKDYDDELNKRVGQHINSVQVYNNDVYTVHHNNGIRGVNIFKNGVGLFPERTIAGEGHNIFIYEDNLYTCDSANHGIINLTTNKYIWKLDGGFPRGVAYIGDGNLIFGVSTFSKSREDREFTDSDIYEINLDTLEVNQLGTVSGYGNIHEIRALDIKDTITHNGIKLGTKVAINTFKSISA
jgi:hypothetical protein